MAVTAQPAPGPDPAAAAEDSYASRLREIRVGVRSDLDVSRHLFRGVAAYVVRDPISFDSHRLSHADYEVFVALRSDRPLQDIFADLVSAGRLAEADEEAFYRFIVELHRLGFLSLPIVDSRGLYRRYEAKRKARLRKLMMAPLFLQIPLFNPDAFLDRTVRFVRPIFSWGFFVFWLILVGAAIVTAILNASRLTEPLSSIMVAGNLPVMWITLIALKVLHEFGHAYSCKIFGGKVPQMGAYIIACTPCAFVDATAAWGFTERRHRLIVCMAGMYVELAIAAVGMLVWACTSPSLVNSIAYNVALLAGVVTVLFNINPLMRYDGYYALSDLLEIPNLRPRAKKMLTVLLKRVLLGVKSTGGDTDASWGFRTFLFTFGLASTMYRVTVVMGIAMLIATKLFLVGMVLACVYVGGESLRQTKNLLRYLIRSPETACVRVRAIAVAAGVFVLAPMAVFMLPTPSQVFADGVLAAQREDVVRARTPGFVKIVHSSPGQRVQRGAALVELANPDAERALIEAKSAYAAAEIRFNAAVVYLPSEAPKRRQDRDAQRAPLEIMQQRRDRLSLQAPVDGVVVGCLDVGETGRYVSAGEPVATIASGGWIVRAAITEQQLGDRKPQVGQEVQFRPSSDPSIVLDGRIERVGLAGSRHIGDAALTQIGGGSIAVDPRTNAAAGAHFELVIALEGDQLDRLSQGMTGQVRLGAVYEPIAHRIGRSLLRLVHRLQQ